MTMSLRDALWLWGTKVNCLSEYYKLPPSKMTVREGLDALGIDQAMMCGGLPPTEQEYRLVAHCRTLLWEMSFEDEFAYARPLAPIVRLHEAHPNVVGVLLDDFSTTEINRGAKPDLLARMRAAMPETMQLWIVVYSHTLDIPNLPDFLEHADGISFWVWNPQELPNLPQHVERCNELSAHKPMVLGHYLFDFSASKPLSVTQMAAQTETGARLLEAGECQGLCFLSSSVMDVGLAAVDWTTRWTEQLRR